MLGGNNFRVVYGLTAKWTRAALVSPSRETVGVESVTAVLDNRQRSDCEILHANCARIVLVVAVVHNQLVQAGLDVLVGVLLASQPLPLIDQTCTRLVVDGRKQLLRAGLVAQDTIQAG